MSLNRLSSACIALYKFYESIIEKPFLCLFADLLLGNIFPSEEKQIFARQHIAVSTHLQRSILDI